MKNGSQQTLPPDYLKFQHFLGQQFVIVLFSWFYSTAVNFFGIHFGIANQYKLESCALKTPDHIFLVVEEEMSFGGFKIQFASVMARNNYKFWNVRFSSFVLRNKKGN